MKFPRKLFGFLLVVVVIAAAGYGIWLRLRPDETAADGTAATEEAGEAIDNSAIDAFSTDVPIPVEGAQVTRGDLILEVRGSGVAAASQGTVIRALVSGQIQEVPVHENQRVGAGRLLVQIDSTENRLALDEARAGLERANATFQELTIGDDRLDPEIKAEREKAARIRAGIAEAEVRVRQAELALERTRVVAPFAGRVASVMVVPLQQVSVGDELLTVVDIDPIRVEVQVLESEVVHLRAGGGAAITFAAFPGETFRGRISTINPIVDDTRHAKVTVTVPNDDGRILPGMYANVILDARRLPDRILVPRSAILERDVDRRTMLFVFDGEGTEGIAEWRYVTPGLGNSTHVEIIENPEQGISIVEPGEIVLVSGHYTLTHGARIRLVENVAVEGGRPR